MSSEIDVDTEVARLEAMQGDRDSTQASEAAASHSKGKLTNDGGMDRVTVRMDGPMIRAVKAEVDAGKFPNRSEAVRSAVRRAFMEPDEDRRGDRR
jgi:hypothetical protein